jgi:hypothetical protein
VVLCFHGASQGVVAVSEIKRKHSLKLREVMHLFLIYIHMIFIDWLSLWVTPVMKEAFQLLPYSDRKGSKHSSFNPCLTI